MHWKNFPRSSGFPINSYFLFSLLSILSSLFTLLKTQPPVLESSSVTDGVYNIDVDVSHDCRVALPHDATGLFAVCD